MSAKSPRCPKCLSYEVFRSSFRLHDVFPRLVLLIPLRCHLCCYRFYRPVYWAVNSHKLAARLNSTRAAQNGPGRQPEGPELLDKPVRRARAS